MPCALLDTDAPQDLLQKLPSTTTFAGMTSRAPMGAFPSRRSTCNSGSEDFCDFCLFFLLYLQHPAAAARGVQHFARASLQIPWGAQGMLMGQGGHEARPVLGCYQGSLGKEQDQGEPGILLEALHSLLSLPVCSLENSYLHRN